MAEKDPKNAVNLLERWTMIYIGFLLLYPLITGPGGYETINRIKAQTFHGTALIYFSGLLLLAAELALTGRWSRKEFLALRVRWGVVQTSVTLCLLFCILSAVASSYPETVWSGGTDGEGLWTLFCYAGIFLTVSIFGRWKRWHTYLAAGTALAVGTLAAVQLMGGNPFALYPPGLGYYDSGTAYGSTFLGTIGNADLLSAYFCLAIPFLALNWILQGSHGKVCFGISLLCWAVLCCSGVSGGVLAILGTAYLLFPLLCQRQPELWRGLLAGAGVCLPFLLKSLITTEVVGGKLRFFWSPSPSVFLVLGISLACIFVALALPALAQRWKGRVLPVRVAAICQIVLALSALIFLWFYPAQSGTLGEASQVLHGQVRDSFGSGRIGIWARAWELISQTPWLGGGPDTFAQRCGIVFSRFTQDGRVIQTIPNNAHNEYLNIWVNTGFFSLLFYGIALGTTVFRGVRLAKAVQQTFIFLAPVICYGLGAMFGFSTCITAPLFWMFWGLLDKNTRFPEKSERRKNFLVKESDVP